MILAVYTKTCLVNLILFLTSSTYTLLYTTSIFWKTVQCSNDWNMM